MTNIVLSLVLLLTVSCGSGPKEVRKSRVDNFLLELHRSYEEESEAYIQQYEKYLRKVENLYLENGLDYKFGDYISSIRNVFELMAHARSMLPQRYLKETGRKPVPSLKEYKLYRTRAMTESHDSLYQTREERLKDDLGEEFYGKLKETYQDFTEEHNQDKKDLFPI